MKIFYTSNVLLILSLLSRNIERSFSLELTCTCTPVDEGPEEEGCEKKSVRVTPGSDYDLCKHPNIDAADTTEANIFFFKGDLYWGISLADTILPCYPRKIEDDWEGAPGFIDAAVTTPEGDTYLLKDHQIWKFKDRNAFPGYPKNISEVFKGIPNNVDAAFLLDKNGTIYFFKGQKYWKYDTSKNQSVEYPSANIRRDWPEIPNNVDAAMQYFNIPSIYFFQGDIYYKFNSTSNKVVKGRPGYKRDTAKYWLSCPQ